MLSQQGQQNRSGWFGFGWSTFGAILTLLCQLPLYKTITLPDDRLHNHPPKWFFSPADGSKTMSNLFGCLQPHSPCSQCCVAFCTDEQSTFYRVTGYL